jgi:cholesterol transport system auxiliary component
LLNALRSIVTAAAMVSLLPGCALLGKSSEPLDTYELSAPVTPVSGGRHTRRQVLVAEPSALKSLDSESIVIKPSAATIQYLKGAQWADRLPRVVQARLVETMQRSGRVGGVGIPGEGLAIDYQIIVDIRSFEIRLDGTDRAEVELYVKVLNDRNGVVRAGRLFSATAPVSGGSNDAFISALDRAFGSAATEIVVWTTSVI